MAERQRQIFTSESVTEGHPDKIADQISDAVLDAVLAQDPYGRVACEVLVTTGICMVAGEITTDCYVDVGRIARQTIEQVGYTDAAFGFDHKTCGVLNTIQGQSPDIGLPVAVIARREREPPQHQPPQDCPSGVRILSARCFGTTNAARSRPSRDKKSRGEFATRAL